MTEIAKDRQKILQLNVNTDFSSCEMLFAKLVFKPDTNNGHLEEGYAKFQSLNPPKISVKSTMSNNDLTGPTDPISIPFLKQSQKSFFFEIPIDQYIHIFCLFGIP